MCEHIIITNNVISEMFLLKLLLYNIIIRYY